MTVYAHGNLRVLSNIFNFTPCSAVAEQQKFSILVILLSNSLRTAFDYFCTIFSSLTTSEIIILPLPLSPSQRMVIQPKKNHSSHFQLASAGRNSAYRGNDPAIRICMHLVFKCLIFLVLPQML